MAAADAISCARDAVGAEAGRRSETTTPSGDQLIKLVATQKSARAKLAALIVEIAASSSPNLHFYLR